MKKFILLFTLIGITACAYAAEWQFKGPVYVDIQSVSKTETSASGWIIHPDFAKSKPVNRTYIYEAAFVDAKCIDREMAILNTAWYNKFHQLEEHPINNAEYIKVLPKTNNEVIFNALCPKLQNKRKA